MKSRERLLHEATMKILEKTGVEFHHPKALEVLKANGIRVEGQTAYFTEEQVMYWVSKAPNRFTIYARNPEHNITIGGPEGATNLAPGYGAPFIVDQDGVKHTATKYDFAKLAKLFHANPAFHVNGGEIVMPSDVPVDNATLLMFYMTYLCSDKSLLTGTADNEEVKAMLEMAAAAFGGKEEMIKYPRMITLINTVTPLQIPPVMLESLFTFVEYGQPVIIGSLAQAGMTGPVTVAGSMALSNSEILAGIALTQMLRPGTPCVYGCETCGSDLRSGSSAIGSPEAALSFRTAAEMARFYGIPCRAGGCLSDSKICDAQSGYESMMTHWICRQSGVHFMIHAAGIVDAYAAMSYEKVIMDFEVIDYIDRLERGFEINEETVPVDVIDEVGQTGQYLTEDHTIEWCRVEPLTPKISVRGTTTDPKNQLGTNIQNRMDALLASYKQPELDENVLNEMRKILLGRGITQAEIDEIEGLFK